MDITPEVKPAPKLFPAISARMRVKNYSQRTEFTYVNWIKRFILHHSKRHPREMGVAEVEAFLNHLAVDKQVSASTQNQAKSALLFLYDEVLEQTLPPLNLLNPAKASKKLPVVLTKQEVQALLGGIAGTQWLIASLLYGSGLRVMECLRLRVNDIDFNKRQLLVRNSHGYKDRITLLPLALMHSLEKHLLQVEAIHQADLAEGFGEVLLPTAIFKKYPDGGRDWTWQYVFPASKRSIDAHNQIRRHHADEKTVQRAIKKAALAAKLTKAATPQSLRDSFATHLLEGGNDIHNVQALLGHKDVTTTLRYTRVLNTDRIAVSSPLDVL